MSKLWDWANRGCIAWTIGTIVYLIVCLFNLVPTYETKFIKKNSVIPKINLFPGQKIQLTFDSVEHIDSTEITKVIWQIAYSERKKFTANELYPTIVLPPSDAGIFNLSLQIFLQNNETIEGVTNLNIVQPTPTVMKITEESKIMLNNSDYPIINSSDDELEIYSAENQWIKKTINKNGASSYLKLNPGDQISPINNEIIIRSAKNPNKLESYSSVPFKK
ncbi:hypothetical protein BN59_01086 [Legionella massiliensis]|uniref:Uncharacterized protein n=1 Tax=Legionella massiliensis TaxID=1034943 RepID=A0A078KQX1_9GAMM|nr:hypothetical protein [Legionella massiliensis]CDZ76810.1 hypothetical protein BN59_01086 [Legionella massiliensis]CEE12548.1 hypothetical protein BN1094_01086 [Legionella massiliensis]